MTFKNPAINVLTVLLAAVAIPSVGAAQEGAEATRYVQVECMKSTSPDYVDVETEIWQPMHQEAVKQGKLASWAFYGVLYGDLSDCDYYIVTTFRGLEQLNADRPFSDYFAIAHPGKNWDEAMKRTAASRSHVRTELGIWLEAVPPTDHRFVSVNQMYAEDGADYLEFEREIWKPIHQALVDDGHSAGWAIYGLDTPHGASIPYNYVTIDYLERLGPRPIAETIRSVHPEMEVAAIFQEGPEVRDHLLSETWVLLAGTR